MAKLRRNHHKDSNRHQVASLPRIILFAVFLVMGMYWLYQAIDQGRLNPVAKSQDSSELLLDSERLFLPKSNLADEVVHHKYYSLGYDEQTEQAEWVSYELTKKSILVPNVKRAKRFKEDRMVSTGSAVHADYYNDEDLTRGHLAPAGDMAFNEEAMQESFYMSNMSPQKRNFNGAVWNELENQVRDWAFNNGRLYVVTGPVLEKNNRKFIGKKNKVLVPRYFYKVLLDIDMPSQKAVAFLIPNKMCTEHLSEFMITIDSLEELTGISFFEDFIEPNLQDKLKSSFDKSQWPVDQKRYQLRLKNWNNRD